MKRITALLCFALLSLTAIAGESWKKDVYESGESVYYSNNMLGLTTSARLLIGERGVGMFYSSGMGAHFSHTFCFISVDDASFEKCEIELTNGFVLKNSRALANQIAKAKKASLKLRICEPQGYCSFAVDGGESKEISWEWNEPLTTTFPDFKPYKVK